MSLAPVERQAAVIPRHDGLRAVYQKEPHFARWMEHPSSTIVHHDRECCEEARLWFLSYARSMEIGATAGFDLKAPTWLSRLYSWGPSEWPISWCQVVKKKIVDCGVFAALSREVYRAQGIEAHPGQALLRYNRDCTSHWKDLWKNESGKKDGEYFPWIGEELVYHEICVIEQSDSIAKLYDSTFGQWYQPQKRIGFGALLAIRSECPRLLRWGDRSVSCGEWMDL